MPGPERCGERVPKPFVTVRSDTQRPFAPARDGVRATSSNQSGLGAGTTLAAHGRRDIAGPRITRGRPSRSKEERTMLARRKFIEGSTLIALGPAAIACSNEDDDDDGDSQSCSGAGATTSVADGHTHFVCVENADLMAPATNATYETSVDDGHSHRIMLSADQLGEIADGGTVTVTTSNDDGHTHEVSLERNG
ncbi:MAG TPA: hypothetical protein VGK73_24480 [Polyangiaceae bacterium]